MQYDDYGLIPDKKHCDDLEDLLAVHLDEKDEFVLKQFDKKRTFSIF